MANERSVLVKEVSALRGRQLAPLPDLIKGGAVAKGGLFEWANAAGHNYVQGICCESSL